MKEYIVDITDDALADMDALYEYIATELQSPENAIDQYKRIADAILSLDSFPDRFVLFEHEPEHSLGIHKMIVDNYVVCYVIDPGIVTVTDVLYGASDLHKKLTERHG
ncbi:MAG: type II toxin-antitoxin system RelE/ParE family toxin [Lachnospiraceae bacterium]|uniref:Type II toxin-antitoxin system RelE/ParE family toxin n=1 Tax=Candidatus Weimeria bifida TaxID=2599074 RepID=A0A6N7J3L0_9FIRM|nr:type II toxin-antitoxin system RelE/ParE family toxin [Candidatus Weimeria bifida]RRF97441.1 MAG: type II toxin-antitoxin system RelE/ParE family toxin [Lachnospiraceae bacterium]